MRETERNIRGLTLLKSWLSLAQRQSYESFGYFDVIGCDSGTIYRIHHGQQANVEQLDEFGETICAWCFVPQGDLVAGDVMLAQKIALENEERAAMSVAVRYAALRVQRTSRVFPLMAAPHPGVSSAGFSGHAPGASASVRTAQVILVPASRRGVAE